MTLEINQLDGSSSLTRALNKLLQNT